MSTPPSEATKMTDDTTPAVNDDDIKLATLTEDPASWKGSSLLSVTQLTARGLQLLLRLSQEMCQLVTTEKGGGGDDRLRHYVLATVFYEASTRTACSFQAAMQRLGGTHIHVDGTLGANTSAGKKGESLEDTIRCLQCYTDVTVLRHPIQGSVGRVIQMTTMENNNNNNNKKPILNAGDGVGEHPTQALLDVYTIYNELKLDEKQKKSQHTPLPPLTIVLLGDLKHGRTVHSLVKLLATASTSRGILWDDKLVLRYCSPEALQMPQIIQDYCTQQGGTFVVQETYTDLIQASRGANVLYVTRVQRERFASDQDYQACHASSYIVNAEMMKNAPSDMIVLHPLPRVDEIDTNIDDDPRAAYFRQMANGMYVRMALLALVLGKAS